MVSDGLTTNARPFADDVSLFSVIDNINFSATNLNSDLSKINAWANQWKMTFNPDTNKQVQEVIFSRKIKKTWHPPQVQKHLGVYIQNMLQKINKAISLLCKLQNKLPRAPLVTIYKSFMRPHLDHGEILYDQTFNNSFQFSIMQHLQCRVL